MDSGKDEHSTTSALLPSWNIDTGRGVALARLLTLASISLGLQGKGDTSTAALEHLPFKTVCLNRPIHTLHWPSESLWVLRDRCDVGVGECVLRRGDGLPAVPSHAVSGWLLW